MTTLNTIIEEEKKGFEGAFMNNGVNGVVNDQFQDPKMLLIRTHFTSAMQRAYEAGREERDTYWKEKVRKEVEKTDKYREHLFGFHHCNCDLSITNEDNLK